MDKDFAIYPALFDRTEEEGITITFPDLPGAISCASSEEEAIFMAKDALGAWIIAAEDLGKAIPAASQIANIKCKPGQSVCLIKVRLPLFCEEQQPGGQK